METQLSRIRIVVLSLSIAVILFSPIRIFFTPNIFSFEAVVQMMTLAAGILVGLLFMPILTVVGWIIFVRDRRLRRFMEALIPTIWMCFSLSQFIRIPYLYG